MEGLIRFAEKNGVIFRRFWKYELIMKYNQKSIKRVYLLFLGMPILNWVGKNAVVNHDKEVPFRLIKKVKSHSLGENFQNLIIKGDNLEALKTLMPYFSNKVKCIYIDPPYNTGNESWVYNDKVNSPKIKKWLGKVVGGESQDLCRLIPDILSLSIKGCFISGPL